MSGVINDIAQKLKDASSLVDKDFVASNNKDFSNYTLSLPVPVHHPRAAELNATQFVIKPFSHEDFSQKSYFVISPSLKNSFIAEFMGEQFWSVDSHENGIKDIAWLDGIKTIPDDINTIVGIGGGTILNAVAYIAEKRHLQFISVPTTVLAAADAAIGGVIRLNKINQEKVEKNFYRSAYEPNEIIVDTRFLQMLSESQISIGCSEIIKHGVYQSFSLLNYLASDAFDPFNNLNSLIKAICWTVALKNVAITLDPDSLGAGGDILRGGHKIARDIEDRMPTISHGEAVAIGVYQDIKEHSDVKEVLERIYTKLSLPRSEAELTNYKS